eukprot:scaffold4240_cov120-Isochrysis_galbana.AAC.2
MGGGGTSRPPSSARARGASLVPCLRVAFTWNPPSRPWLRMAALSVWVGSGSASSLALSYLHSSSAEMTPNGLRGLSWVTAARPGGTAHTVSCTRMACSKALLSGAWLALRGRPWMSTESDLPFACEASMRARAALTDESEASGSHSASGSCTGTTQNRPTPRNSATRPEP